MDRLQQLGVFRRVVETGNITRAARDLNISQPSVSRLVGELEQHLGVPLLNRSSHGLTPTEAGQAFYGDAVRILDCLDEAEASARGSLRALAGPLRIASSNAFFNRVVLPWVPDFLAEHPDISFEARLDERRLDLVEEGLDLGIRVGPLAEQALIARRLGRVDFALYAAPAYLAREGMPDTPEELARHQACVTLIGPHPTERTLEGPDGRTVPVVLQGRFRSSNIDATRVAVTAGLGIGLLPPWGVADCVDAGELVPVLPGWRSEPRDVHAIWPATRAMPRRVRAFVDFLVQRAAADPRLQAR